MHKILLIFFCVCIFSSCKPDFVFNTTTTLNDYPSGSGLSYLNNRIYLIGDDASYLLITDTALNIIDTVGLFVSPQKRMPKELKPDMEAAAIVSVSKSPKIFLAGSGSLSPFRNSGWLIDPVSKEKTFTDLTTFYKRLRSAGMDALNIEGITSIPAGMVLSSRGNKSFPANHLIFTSNEFWNNQDSTEFRICKVGTNTDTSSIQGVSGLEYSRSSDRLLLTVSTENTYNAIDDGAIGKSYLWIIHNVSAKKNLVAINPNKIIDLEEMDERFKGHKIESVCIIAENKKKMQLILVADNDKGSSTLFNVTLKK